MEKASVQLSKSRSGYPTPLAPLAPRLDVTNKYLHLNSSANPIFYTDNFFSALNQMDTDMSISPDDETMSQYCSINVSNTALVALLNFN
jgi:hypothetical protein